MHGPGDLTKEAPPCERDCSLSLSLSALLSSAALAQSIGQFEQPFNHRNTVAGGGTMTHPVSPAAWARARNDLPGPCTTLPVYPPNTPLYPPGNPPAWIRAMHMALIPPSDARPEIAGRVLVFDGNENSDPDGTQFWSIVDPTRADTDPDKFWNFELTGLTSGDPINPPRPSDLGCAGHTWTQDGKLLVAAGTSQVVGGPRGTWFAHEFDPGASTVGNGMWTPLAGLQLERWYPGCALAWGTMDEERILVSGGRLQAIMPTRYDTHEAYDTALPSPGWATWGPNPVAPTNYLFPGPETAVPTPLAYYLFYPWLHLLSNGDLFRSGMAQEGAVLHHVDGPGVTSPALWQTKGVVAGIRRDYGAALLYPNLDPLHTDAVVVIGGQDLIATNPPPAHATMDICKPTATAGGSFNAGGATTGPCWHT